MTPSSNPLWPASRDVLLCVPTALELGRLRSASPSAVDPERWAGVEVVGFGPVAAAARTAQLVTQASPAAVLLVGIAGAYPGGPSMGEATWFGDAAMDGIGAGEGEGLILPSKMGFPQWPGSPAAPEPTFERAPLAGPGGLILTVAAAADSAAMVEARASRFPGALAEDMETFGASLACGMAGVPLFALRGISNHAGDRDVGGWRIDDALAAVAAELERHLAETKD